MTATLTPKPGFDPLKVSWGGPDEVVSEFCSYCGDKIPDDAVPLMMWNKDGWMAQFCDHCMATWFGMQTFPEPPDEDDES